MDARFVNSFMESTITTIEKFLSPQKCIREKVEVLQAVPRDANLHVFIGLTGNLYGTVMLSLENEDSLKLASGMMGGMPLAEHNEVTYSAIQEILNITSGGATTQLSTMGCLVDLTPPTLITGDNVSIKLLSPLISAVFSVTDFKFRISVSLQERTNNNGGEKCTGDIGTH